MLRYKPADDYVPAATIRYWMARRGFNQTTLAQAVGVSQTAVHYWLQGNGPSLKLATGLALARALHIQPDQLLEMPPAQ